MMIRCFTTGISVLNEVCLKKEKYVMKLRDLGALEAQRKILCASKAPPMNPGQQACY